jgi:hypothetical protein
VFDYHHSLCFSFSFFSKSHDDQTWSFIESNKQLAATICTIKEARDLCLVQVSEATFLSIHKVQHCSWHSSYTFLSLKNKWPRPCCVKDRVSMYDTVVYSKVRINIDAVRASAQGLCFPSW